MGIHEAVDANLLVFQQVVEKLVKFELQMFTTVSAPDQTSGDTKLAKDYVEQEDARLDKQIRLELNAMSTRLEEKNTEVMGKLAALEGSVTHVQVGGASSAVEPQA